MIALIWLVPFALGLAVGLGGIVLRRLPLAAAVIFLCAYVGFIAWYGVRTAACPHCNAGDGDRLYYLPLLAGFYGSILGALLAGLVFGAVAGRPFAQKRRKRSRPT